MSGFETRAIHVGQEPDASTGAVIPPLYLSTTFAQPTVGELPAGYDYGRSGTPSRASVEHTISSLENAEHGYVFASGLAAEDTILRIIGATDHVIIPADAYGGTFRLIDKVHTPHGLSYTPVDLNDLDAVARAWQPNTRMVWIESPTNPSLTIVDIQPLARFAKERGALVVVDNTFATPYLQTPLDLGADIVVHSATKYLSGHSDVVAGFVATNDDQIAERLYFLQKAVGAVLAPFDCYLLQRGVKTLAVRMDRHCDNAQSIAQLLRHHPAVSTVYYPGLPSHPNHETASRQMRNYGGMVSFSVHGGEEAALRVVESTQIFSLAESLGAVESLIEHPGRMTHASAAGSPLEVDPSLVRLSIGIENIDDLSADLSRALDRISS
jgi:cystathionine gamma-synthase